MPSSSPQSTRTPPKCCEACGSSAPHSKEQPFAPAAWNKGVSRVWRDALTYERAEMKWCTGCWETGERR